MGKQLAVFLSLWILLPGANSQETVKHLYLANDTHTDLMWNGDEEEWYRYTFDMARFYLKLGESTRNQPAESRSKWNYDTAWSLYMLEKRAPKELFERLIAQLKNGQASVPLNFTLPVYGASTLESVLRSFYYAGTLERRFGIPVVLAVCQENATLPLGLASLWAGSGGRYSWKGVCNCATRINTVGDRDREIYWYTGLDGSRILMKWYSNYGWNADLGGYAEMLEPSVAVRNLDALCGSERYPYSIAGAFGKGWDNIHNYSYDLVWGLSHRTLPGTRLVLSNEIDFFEHFESEYGDRLPRVAVSYGNEWDLNLASLAEVSGKLKRSMEKLRAAEAMAAVVSLCEPGAFDCLDRQKADFLYGIGVYNLHGWTADGPIDRHDFATYMRKQQKKVSDYTDSLHELALAGLGKKIHAAGLDDVFFVFNALNWERDGLVDIPVEKDPGAVRDLESGKILESTVVREQGSKILRVWVEKVPPVGYRLLQLSRAENPKARDDFEFAGDRLETPYYSARLSKSGALVSLFDKRIRKEWAGGPLNDLGGGLSDRSGEIRTVERGRSHITLLCRSNDPVRHECAITFYSKSPRIDFRNRVLQNFDGLLHWSFPFSIDRPEVRHEEVGAVILAKPASAGGHYAERMARTDYLTLNHFVDAGNDRHGITLSNADCLFFRLGDSTPDRLDANSSSIHVLVGGQVNENLGIIRQDGDTLFHQNFSLFPRSGPFSAGEAMRHSLEHQNPFDAGRASPAGAWTWKRHSFLRNEPANAILWTLKPGEKDGWTLRFWNLEPTPVVTRARFDRAIVKIKHASHVETELAEIPSSGDEVLLSLDPHQLKTFRVWLKP